MTKIIPCLDAKNGKVVKGINFENIKEVGEIADLAKKYHEAGADEIAILDITATSSGEESALAYVREVKENVGIPIIMGGGIRTLEDVEKVLMAGASKVLVNSAAVKRPELIDEIIGRFGPEVLVLGIDTAWDDKKKEYRIYTNAGQSDEGSLIDWVKEVEYRGVKTILVTSKDKDGTKSGYDKEAYQLISDVSSMEIIASGGAGSLKDFADAARIENVSGVLAASLFHYGEVEISDLRAYLDIDFSKGLLPTIVVDNETKEVLMQGYMNREALDKTIDLGLVTFYSRSKDRLWTKGEESENYLELVKIYTDCDNDSILVYANPKGPTCHTGAVSCFHKKVYEVK